MLKKAANWLKTRVKLVYSSEPISDAAAGDRREKHILYQNTTIILFGIMYIFFVTLRTASEIVELQSMSVNKNIFSIQQVCWFFSTLSLVFAYKYSNTKKQLSMQLVVLAWIPIFLSAMISAAIPYSISVQEHDIDYTDLTTMWTTMLKNLTAVWPTIQYTLFFLTAFAYGVHNAVVSIPNTLVRIGFRKQTEVYGLNILKEFGVGGFVSGYLIAQRWAFIDVLAPLYLVIWYSTILLELIKWKHIKKVINSIKTIIIFALLLRLTVKYGFVDVVEFLLYNFVTYIAPLLLTIFSSLFIMLMTTLSTELMFLTFYMYYHGDDMLISYNNDYNVSF
jgi:hypothetical protein